MTNEELCDLGKDAYILFTGLWMLADREGRLEDRPRRIKAEAMPLWDDVTAATVEKLLISLAEKGFIQRYEVDGIALIAICKWNLHQKPHPRETPSNLPSPQISVRDSNGLPKARPRHAQGTPKDSTSRVVNDIWLTGNGGRRNASGSSGSPPPENAPTNQKKTERKPPAREHSPEPKNPNLEKRRHAPEDVALIRESLQGLAQAVGLPPPDDGIVHQVLDRGSGASAAEIHSALVSLWKGNKFVTMRSWGLLPIIVTQYFRDDCTQSKLETG